MPMTGYTCPICKKLVLETSASFDENDKNILFNHLISWHKDKLTSKNND